MIRLAIILSLLVCHLAGAAISPAVNADGVWHRHATNYFHRVATNGGSLDMLSSYGGRVSERQAKAAINTFFQSVFSQPYSTQFLRISIFYGTSSNAYLVPLYRNGGNVLDTLSGTGVPSPSLQGIDGPTNTQISFGWTTGSFPATNGLGIGVWVSDFTGNNTFWIAGSTSDTSGRYWQLENDVGLGNKNLARPADWVFDLRRTQPNAYIRSFYAPSGPSVRNRWGNQAAFYASTSLTNPTSATFRLWNLNGNTGIEVGGAVLWRGEFSNADDVHFHHQFAKLQAALNRTTDLFNGVAIFWGDSITYGDNSSGVGFRWASRVANHLGMRENNAGLPASTLQNYAGATDGVNNFTNRIINPWFTNNGARIFGCYGVNDLRTFGTNQTRLVNYSNALYKVLATLIVTNGINPDKITIGSPPLMGPNSYTNGLVTYEAHANYELMTEGAVRKFPGVRYAPLYTLMGQQGSNSLISADAVHPNNAGHAVIFTNMINATAPL